MIADHSGISDAQCVIEIGPGTGAFTKELISRLSSSARLLLVENNARFAGLLRTAFPSVIVVEGCATELQRHLEEADMPMAGSVISGLPWANMESELQVRLLTAIHGSMSARGTFTTFAYYGPHLLPAGRDFRKRLESFFPRVQLSKVELRNLPPAFVYKASKQP